MDDSIDWTRGGHLTKVESIRFLLENVFKMRMPRKVSFGGATKAKRDGEILMGNLGCWVLMRKQQKTGAMQSSLGGSDSIRELEMSTQMVPGYWREYFISKWKFQLIEHIFR